MFEQHENGQLRIGAAGDQLSALPLPDVAIPESDGGPLSSPNLIPLETLEDVEQGSGPSRALDPATGDVYELEPQPRPGQIREPGAVHVGDVVNTEVLEERTTARKTYRLVKVSAGWECAGAAMRWTDGYYALRVTQDGSGGINGRQSQDLDELRGLLERWHAEALEYDRVAAQLRQEAEERTTRRDRLEARADRRKEWAVARDRDGDAAHDRVRAIADNIPFGQPILVGHHSEKGARADQRRIENGMRAACENWNMADRHEQKADGIARQLRTSIFSDDGDAVEKLERRSPGSSSTATV